MGFQCNATKQIGVLKTRYYYTHIIICIFSFIHIPIPS